MTIHRLYEEMDQRRRDIAAGHEGNGSEYDTLSFWLPWVEELVVADLGAHPIGISGLFDDDDTATYPGRPWTPEDGLWDGVELEGVNNIEELLDAGAMTLAETGLQQGNPIEWSK